MVTTYDKRLRHAIFTRSIPPGGRRVRGAGPTRRPTNSAASRAEVRGSRLSLPTGDAKPRGAGVLRSGAGVPLRLQPRRGGPFVRAGRPARPDLCDGALGGGDASRVAHQPNGDPG